MFDLIWFDILGDWLYVVYSAAFFFYDKKEGTWHEK